MMLSTRDLQAGRRGGERLSGQGGPFSEGDTSAELSDSQVTAPCGGRSRAEPWGEAGSGGKAKAVSTPKRHLGGGGGRVDKREQAAILGTDSAKVLPRVVFAM